MVITLPIFVSLCRLSNVYHIQCVCIILVVLCYCFDVLLAKKFKRKLLPLKCITVKIQYLFYSTVHCANTDTVVNITDSAKY